MQKLRFTVMDGTVMAVTLDKIILFLSMDCLCDQQHTVVSSTYIGSLGKYGQRRL